jgi:hypothetical protein
MRQKKSTNLTSFDFSERDKCLSSTIQCSRNGGSSLRLALSTNNGCLPLLLCLVMANGLLPKAWQTHINYLFDDKFRPLSVLLSNLLGFDSL